jgi:hypothetical protein
MRVRFIADYDYTPSRERRVTIAYKAGSELTVKREAGEAAIAAGAAEEIRPFNGAPLEKVDHDGDGRPGGARKADPS